MDGSGLGNIVCLARPSAMPLSCRSSTRGEKGLAEVALVGSAAVSHMRHVWAVT